MRMLMLMAFLGMVTTAATATEPVASPGCFENEATIHVVAPETLPDGMFAIDTADGEVKVILKGGTYCFTENSQGDLTAGSVWYMAAHFPGAPKFETVWGAKMFFGELHKDGLHFDPVKGYYRPKTE